MGTLFPIIARCLVALRAMPDPPSTGMSVFLSRAEIFTTPHQGIANGESGLKNPKDKEPRST